MPTTTASEISLIRSVLDSEPAIRFATVFGSVARGSAGPKSDADVAVAAGRPLTPEERARVIERLAQATGRPIDLVDFADATGVVLRHALRGKRVKCVDRASYEKVILRAIYDDADEMPYRRRILAARRRAWTRT